jgi:hypothetical protein
MSPLSKTYSASTNAFLITSIPMAVYGLYRAYFAVSDHAVKKLGDVAVSTKKYSSATTAVLYLLGVQAALSVPVVRESVNKGYDAVVGDFASLLAGKYGGQWAAQWAVFQRATLCCLAFSLVFWVLELLAAAALRFLGAAYRGVRSAHGTDTRISSPAE